MSLPMAVLLEVLCHMLRNENVPGVPTVHHALGDVNPSSRHVCASAHIDNATHWAAVHPHAKLQFWVFACGTADLQRAFRRCFRSVVEDERHAITSRHRNEATLRLRRAKMFSLMHYDIE